tara:strand:+ start:120 stop:278 length:159 start_codon:yes stop_codon:yes gene_type:complete
MTNIICAINVVGHIVAPFCFIIEGWVKIALLVAIDIHGACVRLLMDHNCAIW